MRAIGTVHIVYFCDWNTFISTDLRNINTAVSMEAYVLIRSAL